MKNLSHFFIKFLLVALTSIVIGTNARHLGDDNLEDSNQLPEIETNQLGPGIKPWQMEMLAEKLALAELQNNNQFKYPEYKLQDSGPRNFMLTELLSNYPREFQEFQRQLRSSRTSGSGINGKRGSRCYFNAVSCFGKK